MSLFAKNKNKTTKNPNYNANVDKTSNIKKSSRNSDSDKLNEKINEEQNEINATYQQIGKIYYEEYKDESDEKLILLCNIVDESNRIIDLCRKQILFLKGIKVCSTCKAELTLDSVYCNKCGAKLFDDNEAADKSNLSAAKNKHNNKCRECGSDIIDDIVFCTNCGAKVK